MGSPSCSTGTIHTTLNTQGKDASMPYSTNKALPFNVVPNCEGKCKMSEIEIRLCGIGGCKSAGNCVDMIRLQWLREESTKLDGTL